jgi:hypothetical protein
LAMTPPCSSRSRGMGFDEPVLECKANVNEIH